jgi:enterochelin esterase-like enzyme
MDMRAAALLLLLTAGTTLCLEEPAFLDPNTAAPAGTEYKTFYSKTLKGDASYLIYLPPGYQSPPLRQFPVVYWLHGKGGNQRSGAVFVAQLDAAIKGGKTPSIIAVLVNGLRDSRYFDSYDGKRPVESVFIKDLIPHIDQTYRTLARREFRAIEGFSMGGFGAARLGFKYPELFGALSIMSGALLDDEMAASISDLYEKNFGSNKDYFHSGSPWVLVRESAPKIRGRTFVRVGVGDRDELLDRNRKFHELLDSLNIRHEYFTVPGVAHEQAKFYQMLGDAAFEFYRKAFERR